MRRARTVFALWAATAGLIAAPAVAERPYPILFVTQTPNPYGFGTVAETFGNHLASVAAVPRGGDLYILYPNGNLKNLTAAAGYGAAGGDFPAGFQGPTAIAVREPAVHWNGNKAIFSMIVGAPNAQYAIPPFYWQLYEVSGLGESDTPVIAKVANQPASYNNVSPIYLSDDSILFSTDKPFNGKAHLHPQRDEYESSPIVTGLWRLDPVSGDLDILDHSPSGDFKPIVDSYGRVIFTRWDHLQRDQQADGDCKSENGGHGTLYGTFDYASELAGASMVARHELFPEPRNTDGGCEPVVDPFNGLSVNQFFPWMMNQDGSGLETLNHIGRHELLGYFEPSRFDDENLEYFNCGQNACGRYNPNDIQSLHQIRESAKTAGRYFGVEAPEFATHASGRIQSLVAEPSRPADQIAVTYVTHPLTGSYDLEGTVTPTPCRSGLYRSPLELWDESLIVVFAGERSPGVPETRVDKNEGTFVAPVARYQFRLRNVVSTSGPCAGYVQYGAPLTPGITKTLWFWSPDQQVKYTGVTMWELDPVEVRARTPPAAPAPALGAEEQAVFDAEGVDVVAFRNYLEENRLALVVSHDVTTRDEADRQQPFNLTVPGGTAETIGAPGAKYNAEYVQFFQGDLVRGMGSQYNPVSAGRRALARVMHDSAAWNPPLDAGDPPGSVEVAGDGSMAALVPAQRAMTWQLTDGAGAAVVRERYWLTFQSGEIRVCASCHGLNSADQAGHAPPANEPDALHALLQWWKGVIFRDDLESGDTTRWSP